MTVVCELDATGDRGRGLLGQPVLTEWLTALGLDPNLCKAFTVHDDGMVMATMYQTDGDGRRIPNQAGTDPLTETAIVPLTVPVPDQVLAVCRP